VSGGTEKTYLINVYLVGQAKIGKRTKFAVASYGVVTYLSGRGENIFIDFFSDCYNRSLIMKYRVQSAVRYCHVRVS